MKKFLVILIAVIVMVPFFTQSILAQSTNEAPNVIPAIREWQGEQGRYELKKGANIVFNDPDLSKRAEIIKSYFKDMLSYDIQLKEGEPVSGDIHLVLDSSKKDIGTEGYLLEINDIITITAASKQGVFYGCITVLQSLYADGFVPKGTAKDYPEYEIRSGMIDVARAYLPLEYVEEITKYMAWFKLNEVHLHINDRGENNYSAFRLESDVPGLTAKDGFYSKDDYHDYQKRMCDYGISVLTEIDTPAHSKCFYGVVPDEYMLDENHLDITNPDAVDFVKRLFDEYITGEDPVFVNKKVHIGTDEYPVQYNEQMRAYTDQLIKHINSRGYTPRFWGAFGNNGFNGVTPVSNEAETNFWAVGLSDYNTLFDMGYDVINTCAPMLYVVPGGNYGFPDYYNLKSMYKNWFVNYMGYNESASVSPDHDQLKGASFALWNDRHTAYGGFSAFDIFDRLKGMICLISEKTWCGEQTKSIRVDDFLHRFDILSKKAGNTNPGRTQNFPISEINQAGIKSIGFPYIASFNVFIEDYTNNCLLFDGSDGQIRLNKNGTISLLREGYDFLYKCDIPKGRNTKLKLIADNKRTLLIVDDTYYYNPINKRNPSLNESSTFVFPLEQSALNLKGTISDLLIEENTVSFNDLKINANLALGKTVTVSGLEVNTGDLNEPLAVDGDIGTRLSFARDSDEQWLIVDLGSEKDVNTVVISFFEHIKEYKILTSTDGTNFTEVFHEQNGSERDKKTDKVIFDTVKARYVKYLQLKRFYISEWNAYYSGGISEFEIYGYDKKIYDEVISEAESIINAASADNRYSSEIKSAKKELQRYMGSEEIYTTHINALRDRLAESIAEYKASEESGQQEISEQEIRQDKTKIWIIVILIFIAGGAGLFFILKKGSIKKKK